MLPFSGHPNPAGSLLPDFPEGHTWPVCSAFTTSMSSCCHPELRHQLLKARAHLGCNLHRGHRRKSYGLFDATADEIAGARGVRFALITGSRDFRHGNILDIFDGGFAAEGFKAKLFDVPGMTHDTADAQTLSAALDFIEQAQ